MKLRIVMFLCLICSFGSPAEARRVALVIGNSSYQNVPQLHNPKKDAKAIADSLRSIGFDEVRHLEDLDQSKMLRALRDFQAATVGAEYSLVYFAGHGVEVNGKNYLIPIDASLSEAAGVDYEGVTLDQVRAATARASKLRLVILDACRNNPFKLASVGSVRSVNRGLAVVEEPSGNELIAYAARAGTVASDGFGQGNSPYAAALIKYIKEPGIDIRQMFGQVRDEVLSTTARSQEPFTYGSLGGESLSLNPGQRTAATTSPASSGLSPTSTEAAQAWSATKDVTSVAILEAFAARYPGTVYSDMALARAQEIRTASGQSSTKNSSSASGTKVAAVDSTIPQAQKEPTIKLPEPIRPIDDANFVKTLQAELKRVGCDPGEIDGKWGKQAQSALDRFRRMKKKDQVSSDADDAILGLVKLETGRVCPLICDDDEIEVNDRCISRPRSKSSLSARESLPKTPPIARESMANPQKDSKGGMGCAVIDAFNRGHSGVPAQMRGERCN